MAKVVLHMNNGDVITLSGDFITESFIRAKFVKPAFPTLPIGLASTDNLSIHVNGIGSIGIIKAEVIYLKPANISHLLLFGGPISDSERQSDNHDRKTDNAS